MNSTVLGATAEKEGCMFHHSGTVTKKLRRKTMQEEVTQKTIALVFKSSRLTADVLKKAMKLYLEHRKAGKQATHGKISIKALVGQGMGASSIEVPDNNIKSFERVAKKYNVDFAVKKDKTVEPSKYIVFFKGKDADVITQAFKEFVKVNEKKRGRVSIKEKLAEKKAIIVQREQGDKLPPEKDIEKNTQREM